jgi:hypothetical protein
VDYSPLYNGASVAWAAAWMVSETRLRIYVGGEVPLTLPVTVPQSNEACAPVHFRRSARTRRFQARSPRTTRAAPPREACPAAVGARTAAPARRHFRPTERSRRSRSRSTRAAPGPAGTWLGPPRNSPLGAKATMRAGSYSCECGAQARRKKASRCAPCFILLHQWPVMSLMSAVPSLMSAVQFA